MRPGSNALMMVMFRINTMQFARVGPIADVVHDVAADRYMVDLLLAIFILSNTGSSWPGKREPDRSRDGIGRRHQDTQSPFA